MTDVMMRAESSIFGSVESFGGVAIAAAILETADSSRRSHLRSVIAPSSLLHASRARERCWEPGSHMACEAWPNPAVGGHIGFEELLSELIARARMLRPHLGSRLFSTSLTYGVRCRTLSSAERCGRMIANPVAHQLAHRLLPSSRSARVPMRAYI